MLRCPARNRSEGSAALERYRILFVGDLMPYLTTAARRDALIELGFPVESIDTAPFVRGGSRLATAIGYRTLLTPQTFALNREILRRAGHHCVHVGEQDGLAGESVDAVEVVANGLGCAHGLEGDHIDEFRGGM